MHRKSLRKMPDKITEGKLRLKTPSTNPFGHHAHIKVMLAAICILTIVVLGIITAGFGSSKTIVYGSSVQGVGVGIYWNQACTNSTLSLNWGLIKAGSNNTLTVYIKNEINSAASLLLGTSNWTPSTSLRYISLNWNYSGQVLRVDQVIPLELTLTVSPTINKITDFSFNTIITITES